MSASCYTALAEAIERGAKAHPQITQSFAAWVEANSDDPLDGWFGTCALGAAYYACFAALPLDTGDDGDADDAAATASQKLFAAFPCLDGEVVEPEGLPGARATRELFTIIVMLNDTEHWTRERIAAWVRTLTPEAIP